MTKTTARTGYHYVCPCGVDVYHHWRDAFDVELARHRNFHNNQVRRIVGMAGAPDPSHPESEENDPGRYGY